MLAFCIAALVAAANMNLGGYRISNPAGSRSAGSVRDFTDEYFEVYSPAIRSQYAQVYWTLMEPVPLDPALVKRFANKTIAITGYEVDQVRKTPQGDVPVPITHAYNHHYVAWLKSEHAEFKHIDAKHGGHGMSHGAAKYWAARPRADAPRVPGSDGESIPLAQAFSEGNGGEFRKSYHGYPEGYGQLLYSPTTFHSNPMQIDTMNRDHSGPGFVPGPLPRTAHSPPGAFYSGLLEPPARTACRRTCTGSTGSPSGRHARPRATAALCSRPGASLSCPALPAPHRRRCAARRIASPPAHA
jgi:hypothetical protein